MRLLLLDIESAPNLVHVWGLYDQTVGINQILATGYVLCFAAKWYGEKEVTFRSVHHHGRKKMLKEAHKLLSEADAVIHYNGTKFDIPTLNKEFLKDGFLPPAPYKQIDLYRVMRSTFRFASNKLDHVLQELDIGKKVRHAGHEMWTKCMAGDEEAWEQMRTYNIGDVVQMEPLYDRLRPWIRVHPNAGLYNESGVPVCVNCGSGRLQRRGMYRKIANVHQRFQCRDCGTWCHEPISELAREDRQKLMRRAI
jgi:hypothetical protein